MKRLYIMLVLLLASSFAVTPVMAKGKRANKRAERKNKTADRKKQRKTDNKARRGEVNDQRKKDMKGAQEMGARIGEKWENFQDSECGPAVKDCGGNVSAAFPSGPACKAYRLCRKGCRKAKRQGKRSCKSTCKGKRGKAKKRCKKSCRKGAKSAKRSCFSSKCGPRPAECKFNIGKIGGALFQCGKAIGGNCGEQLNDLADEAERFGASAKEGSKRRKTRKQTRKSNRKSRRGKK